MRTRQKTEDTVKMTQDGKDGGRAQGKKETSEGSLL